MMNRIWMFIAVSGVICSMAFGGHQTVTVRYLNAALGTIDIRERITVTAAYVGTDGMEEALKGPLRSKELTRFSIKDPTSSAVFELMYCKINSDVFNKLININDNNHIFTFEGIKTQGEYRNGAIIVQSIKPARKKYIQSVTAANTENAGGTTAGEASTPEKYRIIMTDQATSNRVITTDVELGKKYDILGNTVVIEKMNSNSSNVEIIK